MELKDKDQKPFGILVFHNPDRSEEDLTLKDSGRDE